MNTATKTVKFNSAFWFHLFITVLAVFGWFMFTWWLMCIAYAIVMLQFAIFDRSPISKPLFELVNMGLKQLSIKDINVNGLFPKTLLLSTGRFIVIITVSEVVFPQTR